MYKMSLLAAALAAVSGGALAQPVIGAGGQLQQIPPAVTAPRPAPEIRVQPGETPGPTEAAGPRVVVRSLHLTGQTLFPEADLAAAAGFTPGAAMDLAELRAMAGRISAYYASHGYFVAQAYLPVQDLKDGAVTIAVVEGRYGKVRLNNHTNLSDGVAYGLLAGLEPAGPVASAPLERRLLLLSDLPGVEVRSTLAPGASVGTSDLIVDVTPGRRISGSVEADNAGNRYTGAYRAGGTVRLNDPTGHGDVASLRLLSSFDGLDYLRAAYQTQIRAATVGLAYSAVRYRLGKEFAPLEARGSAQVASLYASYPLVRTHDDSLALLVDLDGKTFHDRIGVPSSATDRKALALTVGLNGEHHDRMGGGGWTSYAVAVTSGELDIRTPAARLADAATAGADGRYGKLTFTASRLQNLSGPVSLYGAVRGQLATTNLDISEKMELGGAYGVRAYPEGEAYGDQGYIATLEARLMLPPLPPALPGRMQLVGFVDAGAVKVDRSPWFAGPNRARRSGAGLGLTWAADDRFVVKAAYAHRLGDTAPTSGPDRSGRVWVQLAALF